MSADLSRSPFAFLTALSGDSGIDRQVVSETRGTEVKIVSNMVLASKVSTLYAFSGNGKSSLINAGLIPAFVDLGYAVFKARPRPPYALTDPVEALKEGCIRESYLPAGADDRSSLVDAARKQLEKLPQDAFSDVRRLVERFATEPTLTSTRARQRSVDLGGHLRTQRDRPLPQFLAAAREFLGTAVPMIVICDQFEELFVHYYNSAALGEFAEALRDLCDASDVQVHVLFSMREDWVGSMITLRHVIPDVLSSAYRLDPIRVSAAAAALTIPARAGGAPLDAQASDRILSDLAAFYRSQQRVIAHMATSVQNDPFIELPALQIVGDRLWGTLEPGQSALTASHYAGMARPEVVQKLGSPAAAVLERYLVEMLDAIDASERATGSGLRDLRVDTLYLLTDKSAHRRALSQKDLLVELKAVRASAMSAASATTDPSVTPQQLQQALTPLLKRRLVQVSDSGQDGPRYELAHDFMVRSIVREWNALDHRRAEERGLLEERRRSEMQRLQTFSQFLRRGDAVLYAMIALSFAALLVFGYEVHGAFVRANDYAEWKSWHDPSSVIGEPMWDLAGSFTEPLTIALAAAAAATAIVMRCPAGVIIAISTFIARLASPSFGYWWPRPLLLYDQWLVVMLCMIPSIRLRSSSPMAASRPALAAALGVDYGLFALVVASAMSLWRLFQTGDRLPLSVLNSGLWAAVAVFALTVAQILSVTIAKRTLGWLLAPKLAPWRPTGDSLDQVDLRVHGESKAEESAAGTRKWTRSRQMLKFVGVGLSYGAAWIFLAFATLVEEFPLYPWGNPLYIGLHAVVLAAFLWYARPVPVSPPADASHGERARESPLPA